MKKHKLNWKKVAKKLDYYEEGSLEEYQLKDIEDNNIDEIWYYYGVAAYEGTGQIISRRGENYNIDYLGHCSCYGPTENFEFNEKSSKKSLKELYDNCSDDYKKEEIELFKFAGLKLT